MFRFAFCAAIAACIPLFTFAEEMTEEQRKDSVAIVQKLLPQKKAEFERKVKAAEEREKQRADAAKAREKGPYYPANMALDPAGYRKRIESERAECREQIARAKERLAALIQDPALAADDMKPLAATGDTFRIASQATFIKTLDRGVLFSALAELPAGWNGIPRVRAALEIGDVISRGDGGGGRPLLRVQLLLKDYDASNIKRDQKLTLFGVYRATDEEIIEGRPTLLIVRVKFKPGELPEPKAREAAPVPAIDAAGVLEIAKQLLRDGKPDKAAERLKKIIKDYPGTAAAKEAAELLNKLEK